MLDAEYRLRVPAAVLLLPDSLLRIIGCVLTSSCLECEEELEDFSPTKMLT
jgi:hypothetical protein